MGRQNPGPIQRILSLCYAFLFRPSTYFVSIYTIRTPRYYASGWTLTDVYTPMFFPPPIEVPLSWSVTVLRFRLWVS